jgi:hypothetical protein
MFQYASIKSISVKNGYEFKIPNNVFDVKNLNISSRILEPQDRLVYKYNEKFYHFNKDVFSSSDNTDFYGYFQSYKYFQDYSDMIKKEFSVKPHFEEKAKELVDSCLYSNAKNIGVVSIHVRRGDYLKLKDFHPFVGKKYYDRSMNEILEMGQYSFIVCSDDIEWCKKHITGNNVFYSDSNNSYIDMAIMYLCDHNIVANSSFSWWGAWLNRNPNKIVLYPSVWFGRKCPSDWYDLIPSEWEKMKI